MSEEKVRIGLHLTEEESENLKQYAADCGMPISEFMRQLCKGKYPKPVPPKEFWELLNALYEVHNGFKECSKYEPSALEICKDIEQFIVDLQKKFTIGEAILGSPQSPLCGEKERPRNGELFPLAEEAMNGV